MFRGGRKEFQMDTFYFEQLICDYEKAFGISITIHDELGQLRGRGENNPLAGRHLHKHPYCCYLRNRREGDLLCTQNCVGKINSVFNSDLQLKVCTLCCWKGIHEIIATVRTDGIRMLTLFAGAFRLEDESCPFAAEEAQQLAEKKEELSRVLYALGVSLLSLLETHDEEGNACCLSSRRRYIESFIRRNAHRKECSLQMLAAELCLSVSRCGHLVKEECGENFNFLLSRIRIDRAKQLLLTSDLRLDQIAERTGFLSGNYLARVFGRLEGVSPGRYRQKSWLVKKSNHKDK